MLTLHQLSGIFVLLTVSLNQVMMELSGTWFTLLQVVHSLKTMLSGIDENDDYTYAVYSFPQNYLQKDGRSNIRRYGNKFDTFVALNLGGPVANFTVDDPRITVTTNNNQDFTFTDIPSNLEEVWFQFEYLENNFFLSNSVGVVGSS